MIKLFRHRELVNRCYCGFETYAKGRFNVVTLRPPRPCHKSAIVIVSQTVTVFQENFSPPYLIQWTPLSFV